MLSKSNANVNTDPFSGEGGGDELAFRTSNAHAPMSKTDLSWSLCLLESVIPSAGSV